MVGWFRASADDTASAGSAGSGGSGGSADEFQKSPISCYLSYLRARGLSKIDPNPLPGPSPAKGRLQGSLGEVGEGLEELRESLWELWEGAGG